MKNLMLLAILCLGSWQMCKAGAVSDSLAGQISPFYLQLYAGINKSANENLPWTEFSSYPWAWGAFAGVGKEFTPLWGWRVALRYNHNKGRNVQPCESQEVWGWKNLGLFGDLTLDVSDVLRSSSTKSTGAFNLKAFAGVGLARTWGFDSIPLSYTHPYSRTSRILPAARFGLNATLRLTGKWRLGVELSQTLFEDRFNGVAADFPIDGRTNLKVGITYLLFEEKRTLDIERKNKLKECPKLPLIIPDPEEVKARRILGRAFLDFPVNETVIYPNYRNNENELRRIQRTVDSALFDPSITITRISLHGYASPESPYSNNTRLATGRTESLKTFLIQKYGFKEDLFDNTFTPEDWGNLRGFLSNMSQRRSKGDFWYDNKEFVEMPSPPAVVSKYRDELIEVIDRDMDPDEKEQALRRVGGGEPYNWLYKYVYPGLRHTDYIIDYEVQPYTVKDSEKLIYTHPEALSLREMYLVAMNYEEGSDRWVDALFIAAKQYPDNEIANHNAACACVKTNRLVDAKRYLNKAGYTPESEYLHHIIQAMEGAVKWKIVDGVLIVVP